MEGRQRPVGQFFFCWLVFLKKKTHGIAYREICGYSTLALIIIKAYLKLKE